MLKEIRKAKYPIQTRNDRRLVFLTSADSSTSKIFIDLWLSLHRYILYGVNEITVLHEHKHYFDSVICQTDKV